MHFVSIDADVIDYARTGQGTDKMSAVEGGATTLLQQITQDLAHISAKAY